MIILILQILKCKSSAALHDVQLNQLPSDRFCSIVDPIAVLQFDWSGRTKIPTESAVSLRCTANRSGTAHAVFMWWDLKMDQDHDIILSCAPYWAHPDYAALTAEQPNSKPPQNVIPWRDHWMQAIYYLPNEYHAKLGEDVYLNFNHDEYSLWFEVTAAKLKVAEVRQPLCECGFHNAYSRTRIGQLNDHARNKRYLSMLERVLDKESVVLSLSDGSLIGLAAAAMRAKQLICLEPHRYSHQVMQKYVAHNKLTNVRLIESVTELTGDDVAVTHVIGEPSFVSSIVPFDNLYFGTLLNQIKSRLAANVVILPKKAAIYAMPVEFLDLHKIRSPLGICEGFDLSLFDRFIEVSGLILFIL